MSARPRPLLIYDGVCGFCRYTVRYAEALTGTQVDYAPFQQVGAEFADISREEFEQTIFYIDVDGRRSRGAEAAFRLLAGAPQRRGWLRLYRWLPGFAPLAEAGYRYVSHHRPGFHRLFRWLYGREWRPAGFDGIAWLFVKALALIYLAAFASFASQARGLIGADGILPLESYLQAATEQLAHPYWTLPMLFWVDGSDAAILAVCWLGVAAALALLAGLWSRAMLVLSYLLYLSLFYAGQTFTSFQWDILLLECGFLGMLLPWHVPIGVWLYRLLLFRFMFLAGYVKLGSGDPNWANLTALEYHFETQPLPTALAWHFHHLPDALLHGAVVAILIVELIVPLLIFTPRRLRFAAGWAFLLFQAAIVATGNYNFFNLLAMALCLLLFDDAALARLLPRRLERWLARRTEQPRPGALRRAILASAAAALAALGALHIWFVVDRASIPEPAYAFMRAIDPLRAVNGYGLFAVMTTRRDEIVVEGSRDGSTWQAYGFRYKPGEPEQAPRWIIPHQPRLDWQMWFAALSFYEQTPWFANFAVRLLQHSGPVRGLLAHDPFPDAPPLRLRASLYRYEFTSPAERAETGHWWRRRLVGMYMPSIALRPQAEAPAIDPLAPAPPRVEAPPPPSIEPPGEPGR